MNFIKQGIIWENLSSILEWNSFLLDFTYILIELRIFKAYFP